jgi:hypothetical protein
MKNFILLNKIEFLNMLSNETIQVNSHLHNYYIQCISDLLDYCYTNNICSLKNSNLILNVNLMESEIDLMNKVISLMFN